MKKQIIENQTKQIVEEYYKNLKSGNFEAVIRLFSENAEWRIPGNAEQAVWLKDRNGKDEICNFFKELYKNIESISFDITGEFYNAERAVVIGHLISRILSTGKLFNSYFTVQFTVEDRLITKYLMLEDSYALIEALTPDKV
ncbi:hypothetical protein BAX94_06065 [Elizabethkingia meningoseptica]|uniref:SnoaL-like domain-containing protein n=1 Tax=Elizabethkingia meningoseptica TaxID=238 RepID=A0A1T3FKS7_ELIME|nr:MULTISPECIES: nuclear transport factor 2 family protein [Elizabethkingia]AQX13691.1 hypothetical protein BBD35_15495 [Elizabethkingia meningoseptica]MBG0515483.1 nuclear transport factor 2 family protein [Elizabethkingia meningoseptica]MDE5434150.1 nuclear transport factor 2 family protein [Elizabethkingia meningoseptica]MDE5448464.1 nuclear transport factor 2 family protein [Elizabethkingia meningoseptica]MDE5470428.1 nuclear transport factor 2 family protein [Elizabethkingia meningoseptic